MIDKIFFLHLPRTGGNSLYSLFEMNGYNKNGINDGTEETDTPYEMFKNIYYNDTGKHFFTGHMFMYKFTTIFPKDIFLFTFMRHPLSRTISDYYYQHQQSFTLTDCIRSDRSFINNKMCQHLCRENRNLVRTDPIKALETAKQNLDLFSMIGFQETFDTDIVKLSKMIDIEPTYIPDLNKLNTIQKGVDPTPNDYENLGESIRQLVLDYNSLDLKLYNYAKQKFL